MERVLVIEAVTAALVVPTMCGGVSPLNKHVHHGVGSRNAVSKHSTHGSAVVVWSVAVLNVDHQHGGKVGRYCRWKRSTTNNMISNNVHNSDPNQKQRHNVGNVDH